MKNEFQKGLSMLFHISSIYYKKKFWNIERKREKLLKNIICSHNF